MFRGYVYQPLLLVGETQHIAKLGNQQACVTPTSCREKKVFSIEASQDNNKSFSLVPGSPSF